MWLPISASCWKGRWPMETNTTHNTRQQTIAERPQRANPSEKRGKMWDSLYSSLIGSCGRAHHKYSHTMYDYAYYYCCLSSSSTPEYHTCKIWDRNKILRTCTIYAIDIGVGCECESFVVQLSGICMKYAFNWRPSALHSAA